MDRPPQNQGSPYVPLDSWIYPALDRLAGYGLIDSGFAGMRPWTRRECTRLLSEAAGSSGDAGDANTECKRRCDEACLELEREFRPEVEGSSDRRQWSVPCGVVCTAEPSTFPALRSATVFTLRRRRSTILDVLTAQGWNNVTGFSTYATHGRWVSYFRGEWQNSAGLPGLPLAARETIQQVDHLPATPPGVGSSLR